MRRYVSIAKTKILRLRYLWDSGVTTIKLKHCVDFVQAHCNTKRSQGLRLVLQWAWFSLLCLVDAVKVETSTCMAKSFLVLSAPHESCKFQIYFVFSDST